MVSPKGVRLSRLSELMLDPLDNPVQTFVKEDGEAVTRTKGLRSRKAFARHVCAA